MSGQGPAEPSRPGAAGLIVDGPLGVAGSRRVRLSRNLGLISRAGVHVVLLTRGSVMRLDHALALRPRGPGRLWLVGDGGAGLLEVTRTGLRKLPRPDSGSSLDLARNLLAHEGVTGSLVRQVATAQLPGALADLLVQARTGRVADIDRDPAWTIVESGADPDRHRVTESLFTLCSGGVGLRGSAEEHEPLGQHLLLAAGVYDGAGSATHLLAGPDVMDFELAPPATSEVRILDLRTGVLLREEAGDAGLRSMRFGSITEPGTFALRIEHPNGRLRRADAASRSSWLLNAGPDGGIGAAIHDRVARNGALENRQRLVQVEASDSGPPNRRTTTARLNRVVRRGFDRLLAEQRSAWAERWARVDVRISQDPAAEHALRFTLFHLWSLADTGRDELALGARGLTGTGYGGHVFWDTDVFVLPALVTIAPEAADLLVAYRLRRLDAARERARADGRAGARFPWESARDGHDVTPRVGFVGGERVAIGTGTREEHITADVAWSVVHNARWARRGRLTRAEANLLAETARYWASRIRRSADGTTHIEGVIGPDEYHECVDDNAYTNVMARWNLREAAARGLGTTAERRKWGRLADTLVDGYDAGRGIHEQFAGYFGLEQLLVRDLAEPPVAADVLVGRERIAGSQVVKQPDVLMLHHLVPDELPDGSLEGDYAFYAPRTAHGSSLSPALMACVAARAHHPDEALGLLRLSLRIDLEDLGDTTSAGVHIGACGAAWQAIIAGFLGARVVDGVLELDPVLPTAWPSLEVRFRCAGRDVHVRVEDEVTVTASAPLHVRVTGRPAVAGEHVQLTGAPAHQEVARWAPSPS